MNDQRQPTLAASFAATLADRVRSRRKSLGLRQVDLADLAGCSERLVHMVENGKTTLRLDKLLDILDVLGLEFVVRRKGDSPGTQQGRAQGGTGAEEGPQS